MSAIGVISRATAMRHATATILFHWATVLAVVISVSAIYLRELTENDAIRLALLDIHRQLGLLILIGVPLRIATRYWLGFAKVTAGMAALLRWAASATHVALYASLLALPILGWAATSAKGINVSLFGLATLPGLIAPDPDIADALLDYHQWGAWALLAVVGVHGLAALWHHFVRRDGVLAAMLPTRNGIALAAPSSAEPVLGFSATGLVVVRRHVTPRGSDERDRLAGDVDDGRPARAIPRAAVLDERGLDKRRLRIDRQPLREEQLAAGNRADAANNSERPGRVGEGEAEVH